MCGLVGIASSVSLGVTGSRLLAQALYADQLRGMDSTGVALVNKDNELALYKRALAASDFLQTRYGHMAMQDAESAFVALGHNRATTIGKTSNETAHPFHYGRYVGAHNGTISSHRSIFSVSKHEVDSMNFMDSLDKDGDPIKTLVGIHSGAYAISVYDLEEQQMLFARNEERPLSILLLDDKIMWGSEASMLYWLAERNKFLCKDASFIDLKPNTLYTYCCNEMKITSSTGYTPKKAPYYSNVYGGNRGKGRGTGYNVPGANGNRNNWAMGGTQLGKWDYDFSLIAKEAAIVLQIKDSDLPFMPTHFIPYNNYDGHGKSIAPEAKGKCIGYVYIEDDDVAFPCVFYGVSYEEYNKWTAAGEFIPVALRNGYFTKEGNLVTLIVDTQRDPDTEAFESLPTFYDKMFEFIWERFEDLSQSFCVSRGKFVELKDKRIIAAYEVLSGGNTLSAGMEKFYEKVKGSKKEGNVVPLIEHKKEKEGNEKKEQTSPAGSTGDAKPGLHQARDNIESLDDFRDLRDVADQTVTGPKGKPISIERFMSLTENGCGVCGHIVYAEDADDMAWDVVNGEDRPICSNCTSQMYRALKHRQENGGEVYITRKLPAVN